MKNLTVDVVCTKIIEIATILFCLTLILSILLIIISVPLIVFMKGNLGSELLTTCIITAVLSWCAIALVHGE